MVDGSDATGLLIRFSSSSKALMTSSHSGGSWKNISLMHDGTLPCSRAQCPIPDPRPRSQAHLLGKSLPSPRGNLPPHRQAAQTPHTDKPSSPIADIWTFLIDSARFAPSVITAAESQPDPRLISARQMPILSLNHLVFHIKEIQAPAKLSR